MKNREGDQFNNKLGGLAHLARALAWQARGNRFDSGILHKTLKFGCFLFIIMFYIYIIFSKSLNKYYVGSCQDIEKRLEDHLNSRSKFTKTAKDWELKYSEEYNTRSEAYQREMKIKKMKSRIYIEKLINNQE